MSEVLPRKTQYLLQLAKDKARQLIMGISKAELTYRYNALYKVHIVITAFERESATLRGGKPMRSIEDFCRPYVWFEYFCWPWCEVQRAWRAYAPLYIEKNRIKGVSPRVNEWETQVVVEMPQNLFVSLPPSSIHSGDVEPRTIFLFEPTSPRYISDPSGGPVLDVQLRASCGAQLDVWPDTGFEPDPEKKQHNAFTKFLLSHTRNEISLIMLCRGRCEADACALGLWDAWVSVYVNSMLEPNPKRDIVTVEENEKDNYEFMPTVKYWGCLGHGRRSFLEESESSHPERTESVQAGYRTLVAFSRLTGPVYLPVGEAVQPIPSTVIPQTIKPTMFKSLIGRVHEKFSMTKQQDSQEFCAYIFLKSCVNTLNTRLGAGAYCHRLLGGGARVTVYLVQGGLRYRVEEHDDLRGTGWVSLRLSTRVRGVRQGFYRRRRGCVSRRACVATFPDIFVVHATNFLHMSSVPTKRGTNNKGRSVTWEALMIVLVLVALVALVVGGVGGVGDKQ
ncbi:hypothetical protein BU17DRAFT_60079 [Hysterangium stoloniferum]|nr:hypothetical protein BU17DRAFT_60079 [Hysterangium stoloniferum]